MISMKINGISRQFHGDPNMPLLWYVRDELGLTGSKFGCGMALCGACTMHQAARFRVPVTREICEEYRKISN